MDTTLGTSPAPMSTSPLSISMRRLPALRFVLGLSALLGAIVFLQGLSWDIQQSGAGVPRVHAWGGMHRAFLGGALHLEERLDIGVNR